MNKYTLRVLTENMSFFSSILLISFWPFLEHLFTIKPPYNLMLIDYIMDEHSFSYRIIVSSDYVGAMIGKQGQEQVREHEEAVRGLWVLLELRYYQRASFFQGFMVVE